MNEIPFISFEFYCKFGLLADFWLFFCMLQECLDWYCSITILREAKGRTVHEWILEEFRHDLFMQEIGLLSQTSSAVPYAA